MAESAWIIKMSQWKLKCRSKLITLKGRVLHISFLLEKKIVSFYCCPLPFVVVGWTAINVMKSFPQFPLFFIINKSQQSENCSQRCATVVNMSINDPFDYRKFSRAFHFILDCLWHTWLSSMKKRKKSWFAKWKWAVTKIPLFLFPPILLKQSTFRNFIVGQFCIGTAGSCRYSHNIYKFSHFFPSVSIFYKNRNRY